MRDIKFRGKSLRSGKWSKWIYGSVDCTKYTYKECRMVSYDDPIQYWHTVDKETIGQYTGLKDRNGKEIYEGDIIKCSFYPDFIFEIKFTELCWYMRKIPTSEHINLSDVLYEDLEVIGNIYDNPELLEKGE